MKIYLNLAFLVLCLIPCLSFAQGIIITKGGDTIRYKKIENSGSLNYKYWTHDSEKAKYIKLSEIGNRFFEPEYMLTLNEIDEFTGDFKRLTKYVSIGGTKKDKNNYSSNLVVWLAKIVSSTEKLYFINLRTPLEIGCSGSQKNYAMFKFIDDEVITLEEDLAEIDCGKNAVSTFILSEKDIVKFKQHELKSVRFKQSEFSADFYVIYPDCLIRKFQILNE